MIKQVSVIIVTYNTLSITKKCIESIFEKTKDIEYEIILVDNASEDESCEYFSKLDNITYIYNKINVGFGAANNIGVTEAKGQYILLLNSDTILLNNAVKEFYDIATNSDIKFGCIGTILLDKNNSVTHSYGVMPSIKRNLKAALLRKMYKFFGNNKYYVDDLNLIKGNFTKVGYVIGADMFMKRDVFNRIGGFDERFFLYNEETDIEKRLSNEGLLNYIIIGPRIIHLEGVSSQNNRYLLNKFAICQQSEFEFFKKWNNRWSYYAYRITLIILRIPWFFSNKFTFQSKINYFKTLLFYRTKR
jgi:GT2 family glycosyltransferase